VGEWTDLLNTVLGKYASYLNVHGRRLCFLIYMATTGYWMARNYSLGLIVQTVGCFISMCMYGYGFWNWKNKGIGQ